MNSVEIENIISFNVRTQEQFLGVFALDEIPKEMKTYTSAIINCCPSHLKGIHWCAIYQNSNTEIEFFDSFGFPPSHYNFIKNLPSNVRKVYNNKQLQSPLSNVCGYYCLFYSWKKNHGYRLEDITHHFSKDYAYNDFFVKSEVQNIYKLKNKINFL